MAEKAPHTPDVARYAHQLPDGTILYFESDGKQGQEGELPPNSGHAPSDLERQGFTFLDFNEYDSVRRAMDPIQRAENADADDLAEAFDASMEGGEAESEDMDDDDKLSTLLNMRAGGTTKGDLMNGQNGGMDPEMMAVLEKYMQEGRINELFTPYQQQQQQLAQAQQAPRGASPAGAVFGGLSRALGAGGQAFLNKKMQGDASGRLAALMEMRQKQMGIDPSTGMRAPAVDDATLASIFGG